MYMYAFARERENEWREIENESISRRGARASVVCMHGVGAARGQLDNNQSCAINP